MKKTIDKIFNNLHNNRLHIDLLSCVIKKMNNATDQDDKPTKVVITGYLTRDLGYSQEEITKAYDELTLSGYLLQKRNSSNIFATEAGKAFIQEQYRFSCLPFLKKLTIICKDNFAPILAIISLVISIFTLLHHSSSPTQPSSGNSSIIEVCSKNNHN
jgi:hypothetical protein